MNQRTLTTLLAAAALIALASGCAGRGRLLGGPGAGGVETVQVSGTGQQVLASHSGWFDLQVSGDGNAVRVPASSSVRMLRVTGANHEITVAAGASVQAVRLSGTGTTVHLPKNVHPAVLGNGEGGQILNDVEGVADGP